MPCPSGKSCVEGMLPALRVLSIHRAYVLAGRSLEDDLARRYDGGWIREVDDTLRLKALDRLRCMCAEPDRRSRGAECAAAVQCFPCGGLVLEDDGYPVFVERRVGVGHVAVDEVEDSVRFHCYNAVSARVARGENVRHAVCNALGRRELVVWSVGKRRDRRMEGFDFVRFRLDRRADDLRIREGAEHALVVDVLVGNEYLRYLLRLVAKLRKCVEV